MRTIHDIHGGIYPPERKTLSRPGVLHDLPLPPRLVLPLSQHIGAEAEPIISIGERVSGGQLLAKQAGTLSAAVHAPTSGTIAAIGDAAIPHPSGLTASCLTLEVDGLDEWIPTAGVAGWRQMTPEAVIARVEAAGIVGLGGAGFPTAAKLIAREHAAIHTVLINGTECEPYITADDTLMQVAAREVIEGAVILAHCVGAENILIGIEDNKPEATAAMRRAATADWGTAIEIASFPTKYPSGGEKQLIEILTGQQVPRGGLPADLGIVCQNPGTAVAVRDAIIDGKPLTHRVVTLTGESLSAPQNVRALLGTPIDWLLDHAGFRAQHNDRVIHGGPMMGFSLNTTTAPVIKTTNCLLAPTREELRLPPDPQACIRCGLCAEACPATLLPQQLYWYARAKDTEQLEKHHLFDCIECGACAWVCPSHIPLVQYYRAAKSTIRAAEMEKERADVARQRFEFRQARVEQEAAEKAAKRAARKAAATSAGSEDPVQAAIARAQARKAAQAEGQPDDPVQAAIARVQAKKAAAEDPVQAAIARVKARKAAEERKP